LRKATTRPSVERRRPVGDTMLEANGHRQDTLPYNWLGRRILLAVLADVGPVSSYLAIKERKDSVLSYR